MEQSLIINGFVASLLGTKCAWQHESVRRSTSKTRRSHGRLGSCQVELEVDPVLNTGPEYSNCFIFVPVFNALKQRNNRVFFPWKLGHINSWNAKHVVSGWQSLMSYTGKEWRSELLQEAVVHGFRSKKVFFPGLSDNLLRGRLKVVSVLEPPGKALLFFEGSASSEHNWT